MINYSDKVISFKDGNLSPGLIHYLDEADIHTLNQVATYSKDEILSIPGIGITLCNKLEKIMNNWGLSYRIDSPQVKYSKSMYDQSSKELSEKIDILNDLRTRESEIMKADKKLQALLNDNREMQHKIIDELYLIRRRNDK